MQQLLIHLFQNNLTMNKVEEKFIDKALNRSGVILYSKFDALEFIKECAKNNVGLLGIDGFFITDKTTQPSLNDSIDFSIGTVYQNIYDKAKEFIEKREDSLYYEIVCE
jgi:hypothetical protein